MTDIQQLERVLESVGYTIKHLNSKSCAVLVENNKRIHALNDISFKLKGIYDPKNTDSKSSIGYVAKDGFKIYAKPSSKQGFNSSGVPNELILVDKINYAVNVYGIHTIIITDSRNKKFTINNVMSAEACGSDTRNRKKADIIIRCNNGIIPISIKMVNAQNWESGDKYHRAFAEYVLSVSLSSGEVSMVPDGNVYRLSREIASECDSVTARNAMFGSDIQPNGAIIVGNFLQQNAFLVSYPSLLIYTEFIIRDLSDLKGTNLAPFLLIRNDRSRLTGVRPGIRCLIVAESRITNKCYIKDLEEP